MGVVGESLGLHEIGYYHTEIWGANTVQKAAFRNIKMCTLLNKNSEYDTLSRVLCASVCWLFRTATPPVFKQGHTTHSILKLDWLLCGWSGDVSNDDISLNITLANTAEIFQVEKKLFYAISAIYVRYSNPSLFCAISAACFCAISATCLSIGPNPNLTEWFWG